MKKRIIFLIIFLLIPHTVLAQQSTDVSTNSKTIKQLQEEVETLTISQKNIENELHTFLQDAGLQNMIRTNLTNLELIDLQEKVTAYTKLRKKNNDLLLLTSNTDTIKKLQTELTQKKDIFYKTLLPYVKPEQVNNYIYIINANISLEKKKTNLEASKNQTNDILYQKVENLKDKIEEDKQELDESIKEIIEEKMQKKLQRITNLESFKTLTTEKKLVVLDKTLEKILQKKEKLIQELENNTILYSDSIRQKIEIYKVAEKKFIDFKTTFQ